jgi:hypothetical protein
MKGVADLIPCRNTLRKWVIQGSVVEDVIASLSLCDHPFL